MQMRTVSYAKTILLTLLLFICFCCLSACSNHDDIQSLEFTDTKTENIGFGLFGGSKSYDFTITVSPANIDIKNIEIIADDLKCASFEVKAKKDNLVTYTVKTLHNGTVNICAKVKDKEIVTANSKRFIITGGTDPTYAQDELNILELRKTELCSKEIAETINQKLKEVGFSIITKVNALQNSTESQPNIVLVTSRGLVLDVEFSSDTLSRIVVNSNNGDILISEELVLYDKLNLATRAISEKEYSEYLNSQKTAATNLLRETVANIIQLTKLTRTSPNSAGGVDVNLKFKNMSSKTIKYIHMSFYAVNAVGDQVYCSIRDAGIRIESLTGPIGYNVVKAGKSSDYWYNYNISAVGFNYFEIEYMDGTSIVFDAEMIRAMQWNSNNP